MSRATDGDGATFASLGLRAELITALTELGYEEPTPIQRESIPHLLAGRDLLGQAATGTGKTAAFALPALDRIEPGAPAGPPSTLVLVPTRELAVQVSEAAFKYGRHVGARVLPIYGGQPIHRQFQQLDRGAHIVVATPGRAVDHIGRGTLPLDDVGMVVLDEADEMLDMGFADDLETILQSTPDSRQTVLFSATLPKRIVSIARRYQRDPVRIEIARPDGQSDRPLVQQRAYVVQRAFKPLALGRILDVESPDAAIVFCRTRGEVDDLTVTMNGRGYRAEALHGGMDQQQRDRVMARLRDGTAELLIATDVAARGLDVSTLTHVVNYDVPSSTEGYVHRIGRVGRAGREGVAITLAEPKEQRTLANIERATRTPISIERVPTVDDLRERRLRNAADKIREALTSDLAGVQPVLDELAGEHDLRQIALAAIKIVHDADAAGDDLREIPDLREPSGANRGRERRPRDEAERRRPGKDEVTGFLYIGVGRKAGVRPGDLVGAIANESGLTGREIGPIRISEHYSVVGVPERSVDTVVDSMGVTSIRGKRASVRRYTD